MTPCPLCSSSWDEHVFELVLPKACMVGHVDFKFVLNANIVNIPQLQVTLLKNKAPGLGKVTGELPFFQDAYKMDGWMDSFIVIVTE